MESLFVEGAAVYLRLGQKWVVRHIAKVYKTGRFVLNDGLPRKQWRPSSRDPFKAIQCGSYSDSHMLLATPETFKLIEEQNAVADRIMRRRNALYDIEQFVIRWRHHTGELPDELAARLESLAQELEGVTRKTQSQQ